MDYTLQRWDGRMMPRLVVGPLLVAPALVIGSYLLLLIIAVAVRAPVRRAKGFLVLYFGVGALAGVPSLSPLLSSGVWGRLQVLYSISEWARLAWPATFFLLTLAFLYWQRYHWLWWTLGPAWLGGSGGLALPADWLERLSSAIDWARLSEGWPVIGWTAFLVLSFSLSLYASYRTARPRQRNRVRYWLLIQAAMGLGALFYLWPGGRTRQAGSVIMVFAGWLMAYAVLQRTLVDLRRIRRSALSYLAVTLLTIGIYLAMSAVAQALFAELAAAYARLIGISVAAVVVAILYQPLYGVVQHSVDRLLSGMSYEYMKALRDYSQIINRITDLNELAVKSITLIGHALGIERGALLTIEKEEGRPNLLLRVIPGMGVIDAFPTEMPPNHPWLRYFQETGSPLLQRDIDRLAEFAAMPAQDKRWLHSLGMAVYVPVKSTEGLIGILALGPKGANNPYYSTDLELLATLGDQTVLALRNAQQFADLTALNAGIAQLNEELRRLDESKSNFLAIASHELRTPLTLIQGYASILAALPPEELRNADKVSHIVAGISKGAERLRHIIDEMLDIARLDADKLALQWKECNLSHIIQLATEHLRPVAEERKQTLEVQGLDSLPLIEGDPQRLHQAFRNLIENAIKFTPDGGRISVSARLLGGDSPEDQFVEVVVADTGIGIAPENQERIFERFYRVGDILLHSSSDVNFKGGGPGLGLAITRGIIEAHGGKIWVASEGYDEESCPGSEFHVLLMVKPPSPQEQLAHASRRAR